jgi:phosphomevalonate kinase
MGGTDAKTEERPSMIRKTVKSSQMPPKRELYTPGPVRERVVALHMSGESKRKIARTEKIDRETVSRILSQREVVQRIAHYQGELVNILPKVVGVLEKALDSENPRVALAAANKVMTTIQILYRDGVEKTMLLAKQTPSEWRVEEKLRKLVIT